MTKPILSKKTGVLIISALMLFNTLKTSAQINQSDKPVFLGLTSYYGSFQVHASSLYPYNGTHPFGVEFEISRLLLNDNIRENLGTFVKWGVGLNYVNFNHHDLGYSISGIGYIEPFIKTQNQWRYSLKIGGGLAYMSNPFDEVKNPQNLTYSTRLAFPLYAGASVYYFFTKQLAIKASASFQHISNGGIKQPNLGINYPVIGIGMELTNNSYSIPPRRKLNSYKKEKRLEMLLGYSLKEDTTNTNDLNVVTLMVNRSWQISRINALTAAALVEYQQMPSKEEAIKEWSLVPMFGHEFLFGRLRFGQQIGAYVIRGDQASNLLMQNYYLRYIFNSRILTGVNLKAHGRVADYLSIQLGILF